MDSSSYSGAESVTNSLKGPQSASGFVASREDTKPKSEPEPEASVSTISQNHVNMLSARVAIAAIYLLLAAIGKLLSLAVGDTYFAHKHNFINVYFVKLGWLWTTLAFWVGFVLEQRERTPGFKPRSLGRALLRYLLATVWWLLFTSWFFGAPLMDRVFTFTGGQCRTAAGSHNEGAAIPIAASSRQCRQLGGDWTGGHDPSGHYFLLIHASLLLWYETLPLLRASGLAGKAFPRAARPALLLVALWGWMFLVTSIYFHSLSEKITGMFFGLAEIALLYGWAAVQPWAVVLGLDELL